MAIRFEAGMMESGQARFDRKLLRKQVLERTEPGGFLMVSVPAPLRAPTSVFSLLFADPGFFWRSLDGVATAGAGVAHGFSASGDDRFELIRTAAEPILGAIKHVELDTGLSVEPRLYGGFAFRAGGTSRPPWSDFEDARFTLPRFRYTYDGKAACLSLCLTPTDLQHSDHSEHWLEQLLLLRARIERVLPSPMHPELVPTSGGLLTETAADVEAWNARVSEILAAIRQGKCEKVVLARCSELSLAKPIDVGEALLLLAEQAPGEATCFAFRFGESTFIGATPERLVSKYGLSVRSEALAGSVRTGDAEHARQLLADPKELREHKLVVGAILDALSPLCSRVEASSEPEVRQLRHLLHLRTPIAAELSAPVHVLELARRLHPTPAVGGVPNAWATTWIAEHEAEERGWYAGPVGWFNAAGDGEIDVALRSGLIRGQKAFLYAGAGIVEGSGAENEYAETRLKLASVLSAIRAR